jgi:crotonobetainyl-CoA:carnitine CoA-transferase CaiB-like acyl-CoA transferase
MTPIPPARANGEPLDLAGRGGPLEGLVVVELARGLAGEFAGGLLADLGATVIKVEPPAGSPMRRLGPAIGGETDSLSFQSENRGKYSVCADVKELAGENGLGRLLASADALVEDLGPGRLEAAGLSPDALAARNPRLAVLRISPFGQTGPLAEAQGDDRIAQAFSGVQFTTGFPDRPPIPVTLPLLDCWTGLQGVNGLLMAIFDARRSGLGQVVDIGLYQMGLRVQEEVVVQYHRTGAVARRMGTESPTVVPANVYATRDGGWIAVSGAGDQPFARLCQVIEAPDAPSDPRFRTPAARLQNRAAADELVRSWIARHDAADVEVRFTAGGVTGTAVRSVDDIIADEHVRARGDLLHLQSATGRDFLAPGAVPKLSRTPAAPPRRAPQLGEHTELARASVEAIAARAMVPARPARDRRSAGPLAEIRVLDLSQWLAGPVAATILADFGADVIMVELPGDVPRTPGFCVTNRNKRSVALDVRGPEGREAFLDLVRVSDVVVENFRPGTLERWNLGPAVLLEINPRLVLLRASGFGQSGPYARRAAFNPVGLAFGGATYLNGWPDRPPLRDGVMAGDYSTALFNVLGILAALLRRDVDRLGQVVDTAMFEAVLRMTGDTLAVRSALALRRERAGGDWPIYPASMTLEAAEGRFVAVSSACWSDLAAALERLGRPRLDDLADERAALAALVRPLSADDAASVLREAGLPASPVNSIADLSREPHLWHRGDLVRLPDPELGEIVTPGVVPLLSRTPGRVAGWSPRPGSDSDAVLGGVLGYAPEQIRRATGTAARPAPAPTP